MPESTFPVIGTSISSSRASLGNASLPAINDTRSSQQKTYSMEIAKSFLDDLMTPSDARTFTITEYRDLKVRLLPTTDMDRESADIYVLRPSEISKDTWIVEIDVSFQYEGVISPIGSADQRWIDILYQGSPIGFLLTRNGTEYTMRSRYSDA